MLKGFMVSDCPPSFRLSTFRRRRGQNCQPGLLLDSNGWQTTLYRLLAHVVDIVYSVGSHGITLQAPCDVGLEPCVLTFNEIPPTAKDVFSTS